MELDRWEQIERLYHEALELAPDARGTFLAQACGGDEEMRREVASLLHHDGGPAIFFDAPMLEFAAQLRTEEPTAEMFDPLSPLSNGFTTPESESPPAPPVFIGDHRILRKLGEGGMGVVYEAEQQNPRRHVALKVIRGGRLADEYQVKLFRREAQALARLKHPGIAAIYEAGRTDEGRHYFVMELVRGIPLLDYVKGGRLTGSQAPSGIKQRLELFLEICGAISYAHQRGVIHRDLKPANILVVDESEGQGLGDSTVSRVELKVLDFGLARITEEDGAGASGLSQAGQVRGTLPYMSPEQVSGDPGKIDVRTDIYALGVILYELLAERLPYDFEHAALPQAIRIICEEDPKPLSRARSELRDRESGKAERIDRDVETITLKALEKEPERRYQSVAAMAEDVARYLTNQPIQARPPSALYQFRKLVARHKAPFALLAMVFALLLGVAIMMAMQSARIARERDKAVAAERVAAEQRDVAQQARNAEREQRDAVEQARNAEQEQRLLAEANLKRAEEQRDLAEEQRTRAERQELSNRRLLYAAHMNLAQQAWENADAGRVEELLESHRPLSGGEDLRGFEWYYLWRLSHRFFSNLRHNSYINSVAFSPDGKWLATGSDDGTVKLWDVGAGQELLTLKGHSGLVWSVAFSPDGKRLATASYDRTVKLWEAQTGQELATLKGHADNVYSVAFSPDGKTLASGSEDKTVKLWDALTKQELATLKGHAFGVHSVAFSPEGKTLASGSRDNTVKLWDAATRRELLTLKGHSGGVWSVAFSPDRKRLATGSADGSVKLWDAGAGQELLTLKGHSSYVYSVAFSPDGKWLATGSRDHTVKLWDAANGQELLTLNGHS
ncbi:MAG TPA: protein kinase, partial [Pyrinomonadaceae bacterium]|nr:protein kinase [Pyrinomonadaceae bacterium]